MEQGPSLFFQLLEKLVLGLIQGVTEVFPVSSSGHLSIAGMMLQDNFGLKGIPFEISVFLHFGTFVAILLFYQKDVFSLWRSLVASLLKRVGQSLVGSTELSVDGLGERTPFLMLVSLSLTVILALGLRSIAKQWFEDPLVLGGILALNGLIISLTGQYSAGHRRIRDLNMRDYAIIGLAQGLAALPGLSRFGLTLSAGLWRKMGWFDALKLSFLLSLPTVLAAGVYELLSYQPNSALDTFEIVSTVLGILMAVVGGCLAIRILLQQSLHARKRLVSFGIYCIALGMFFSTYVVFLR